jgi:hypothetical protein
MEPTPKPAWVGYFAKEPLDRVSAAFLGPVEDIASVAECIVPGADDWRSRWVHNAFWRFDNEELALSVVPPDGRGVFDLYAYEILPVLFVGGEERPLELPTLDVKAPGPDFAPLGYDVVVLANTGGEGAKDPNYDFGCSPLTCNSLMKEVPVNDHCLLDSAAGAMQLAKRVSASQGTLGEPGDYVVVRVWRKRR